MTDVITEQSSDTPAPELPLGFEVWEPGITAEQYDVLMRPLARTRVSTRSQGGKNLSYVEAWDIKAHLTRIFGFGNWDLEMLEYRHVADRAYMGGRDNDKEMVEVIYSCRMQLRIRNPHGQHLATYCEAAVGTTSGPASMLGEHHDNALKTAASDATKRCAINLGTQFGLSLYDNGTTTDIIKKTVVKPKGVADPKEATEAAVKTLENSLGATVVGETQPEGATT
jgi:recombination DNA repair RAD52 pathway protein